MATTFYKKQKNDYD